MADSNPPHQDEFYRETLKALSKELRTISQQGMEQNRLTGKLIDAVGEVVTVAKDLRDVMRETKNEIAMMRAERRPHRPSSVPPLVVARTKTGG